MNRQDKLIPTEDKQRADAIAPHDTERISTTKRTLLKAGWIAPVIAAISLPASGFMYCSSCNELDR